MDVGRGPNHRGAQAVAISIAFTVIAGCFVGLRAIARFGLVRNCGIEDVFIIVALGLSIALAALIAARKYRPTPIAASQNLLKRRQKSIAAWEDTLVPCYPANSFICSRSVARRGAVSGVWLKLIFFPAVLDQCHRLQRWLDVHQILHFTSIPAILRRNSSKTLLDYSWNCWRVRRLDMFGKHLYLYTCGLFLEQEYRRRSLP